MKTKSRLGKTDSIFAKTGGSDSPPPLKTHVIASPGSSIENKLTVILPPDQVAFLDRLCLDIRAKTKNKIRRTEIIRALIAGVRASGLDLTAYNTEDAIADAIRDRLSS
jgi:hypothetical protein